MSEALATDRDRRFRRHFLRLWLGQVTSGIGDQLHHVALVWIAVEAVGEQAGWVMAAGAIARLVFGLAGGVYADRWDRQKTLIGCDLLGASLVGTLVFADPGGSLILFHLAAVATGLGILDSVFQPALQASLPAIAPDAARLQTANAWIDVTRRLALTLGPMLTGLLLAWMPLQMFFTLDAATFAASALFIASLGRHYAWKAQRSEAAAERPGLWAEVASAARLVAADDRLAVALAQHVVWNFTLGAALTLGIAMIVNGEALGGPALLGYATGAYGVGNVASNLVLASRPIRNTMRMIHLGALIASLGWLLAARVETIPLLAVRHRLHSDRRADDRSHAAAPDSDRLSGRPDRQGVQLSLHDLACCGWLGPDPRTYGVWRPRSAWWNRVGRGNSRRRGALRSRDGQPPRDRGPTQLVFHSSK